MAESEFVSLYSLWQLLSQVNSKVDHCLSVLNVLVTQGVKMSAELDALTAQVAANTTVEQSAITLINGLAAQITALANSGGTPAQFVALSNQLKTSADALAAAIAANTTPPPAPAAMAKPKP